MSVIEENVSLSEIFWKIWYRRYLILAVTLLSTMLGVIYILLQSNNAKNQIVYYIKLTTIDKSLYPNGAAFSPQDLKSPEVLAELADRLVISDNSALQKAIIVSFASPITKGVLKKYEGKLNKRGISSAEIDALNDQLKDELGEATQRTLRISVDYKALGLSVDQGAEMAILLPQVWSNVFTTKFRILDTTKMTSAILPDRIVLSDTLGIIEAKRVISNVIETLDEIENDNRLRMVNGRDGITPFDLRSKINHLNETFLTGVLSQNIASGDELAQVYIIDLTLMVNKLDEELAGVEQTIQSLQSILSRNGQASEGTGMVPGGAVQLTGNGIDEIVALVNRSTLAEYLTALYEKKSEMISKRVDLKVQIRKIDQGAKFSSKLIEKAEKDINALLGLYSDLLKRSREMAMRTSGELHRSLGGPYKTGSFLPPRAPLILLLSGLIGGFLGLSVVLFLPSSKQKGH